MYGNRYLWWARQARTAVNMSTETELGLGIKVIPYRYFDSIVIRVMVMKCRKTQRIWGFWSMLRIIILKYNAVHPKP